MSEPKPSSRLSRMALLLAPVALVAGLVVSSGTERVDCAHCDAHMQVDSKVFGLLRTEALIAGESHANCEHDFGGERQTRS